MPSLDVSQIQDLVQGTLDDLGRARWTDLATDLQHFEVMPRLMRRNRVQFKSAKGVSRNIMKKNSGNARHVGLFASDSTNVQDVMTKMNVPPRHTTTSYAFDRTEPEMQGDESEIFDVVEVRRADAMIALAELLEEAFWSKPSGTDDNTTPWGLEYWLGTSATEGFNGGAASGFTTVGGVNPATLSRWKNYTGSFSTVSKADLIRKMRKAKRKTNFMSPIDIPDYRTGRGQRFRIYCNEQTIAEFEAVGESQNENLGRDLASMDGSITFGRNPLVYVPWLDDNASQTDLIQMIDWGVFFMFFIRGEYFRETVKPAASQHKVVEVHVDLSWNMYTTNRRAHSTFYRA